MAVSLLIVEDGTAKTDSNTYVSLADADQYHEDRLHNADWKNAVPDTKNAALLWATRLLDDEVAWDGSRVSKDQALRWPRIGIVDKDGFILDSNKIPSVLADATSELAFHLIVADRTVFSEDTSGQKIASLSVGSEVELKFKDLDLKDVLPPSIFAKLASFGMVGATNIAYSMLQRV